MSRPSSNDMELFYSDERNGNCLTLNAEESAHCVRVLRHRAGDEIMVIDGTGNLFRCTLISADVKQAEARIEECRAGFGGHPYHLTMAVCPTKNADRYEWFVEKATEIGVDRIIPVIVEHSERKIFKTDRIRKIALSACKQSLKAGLPEILETVPVSDFINGAGTDCLKLICYCDSSLPRELRSSIKDSLNEYAGRDICILIGPEGDFSQSELDLALANGWRAVHLGDSRLRTETAAIFAVAAVYDSFL